jgi:tetratricopeptide (TPR) repeat protein
MTTQLRLNRAMGLHMFERRYAEAEADLLQVVRENPGLALAYVRLGMVQVSLRRFDDALEALHKARAADPLLPVLSAAEVGIQFYRRDFQSAVECATRAMQLHPYFHLGRACYAQSLEYAGRATEAMEQYRLACVLSPDLVWLRALEGGCLARCGRPEQALEILAELEQVRSTSYVDAYYMAALTAALGKHQEALQELDRALEENSPTLTVLGADPKLDSLRASPRFARLQKRVHCGPSLTALAG